MPRISTNNCYLGIDPGQSGGLAMIDGGTVELYPMPDSYLDLYTWINSRRFSFCAIEKVHSMPGQGVASTFKFGKGFGALLMAVVMIPHEEITPQRWQKGLGIPPRKKDEAKPKFKKRLRAFAEKLFPRVEGITDKTADALLIAEFARRYREGKL